jgi:hypothetical protein
MRIAVYDSIATATQAPERLGAQKFSPSDLPIFL